MLPLGNSAFTLGRRKTTENLDRVDKGFVASFKYIVRTSQRTTDDGCDWHFRYYKSVTRQRTDFTIEANWVDVSKEHITSILSVERVNEGRNQFTACSCWSFVWLTLRPWRWRRYVPPNDVTLQCTASPVASTFPGYGARCVLEYH
jgi:hypothetical protein